MQRQSGSSRSEAAYLDLRAQILAGRILPGEKLNTSTLCDALDGSLVSVREALSRLTAEGLVALEPFKGFRVAPISADDLRQLIEARIAIERLCLSASIAKGGIEWEGQLVSLLHQLSAFPGRRRASDVMDEWCRIHHDFHEALASACDNVWLQGIRRRLYEQGERYRRLPFALVAEPPERDSLKEHANLVQAVLDRDATAAGNLMAVHLELTGESLLACMEDTAEAPQKQAASG